MEHRITTPISKEQGKALKMGDKVLLSGIVYTARDAAHQRMIDLLDQGKPLPIPLKDAAVYYVGPTPTPPGRLVGSAGPTTSGRMDSYAPRLLDLGLRLMIGKGKRSPQVKEACLKTGAIYLAALGGAGALMASKIQEMDVVCWEDLGCEAIHKLQVVDLPLTVILDTWGGDLYESGPLAYLSNK